MNFMRSMIVAFVCLLPFSSMLHAGTTRGYYKKNGTYVKPYHKSNPDSRRYNNYSAKGNINPYTGKKGTQRHEYSNPPKRNKSASNPKKSALLKDTAKYKSGAPRCSKTIKTAGY